MSDFLLIHGACHGGWCWDEVSGHLRAAGHRAFAPDLPCDSLDADLDTYADVAVAALGGAGGDVVVVGHSLGGLVVPLVASRVPVRRMVMLAAIVGAPGASMADLAGTDSDRDLRLAEDEIEFDPQGRFRFSQAGAQRALYHDCPPALAQAANRRLRFQRSMWEQVSHFEAWPQCETVSITCTQDRVVNPQWSDRVARERLGVEPVHLPGGHSPFLSRPAELAELLRAGP
jgi:pimeloyl-ACP methyl ester carboxylesterase